MQFDWDEVERAMWADVLTHTRECETCRTDLAECDRLRRTAAAARDPGAPEGGWEAFEERLMCSLSGRRFPRLPVFSGVAAVLAVGFAGLWLSGRSQPAPPLASPMVSAQAFTAQEIAEKVGAFQQVSQVFDGRAGWVLLASETADVGLRAGDASNGHGGKDLVLLRLVLSHDGAVLSRADLVIVPGQSAELRVPSQHGQEIHYQVSIDRNDPAQVQLWVEVKASPGAAEALGLLATTVRARPGAVLPVGEIATAGGRYRIEIGVDQARVSGGERL
jgi:hypothetical protein